MAETFAQLGRIEAIRQLFEGSGYTPFGEPLWLKAEDGAAVTTATKVLLEGVDFNLVYFPLKHLGYKSVLSVTGELYAVMAHPETLSVTLGVSAKLDYEQIKELWSGVVAAAREHGYKSLSLELQPSRNGLCISMSASGADTRKAIEKRPEAKSKDLICVSGSLGAAYLGFQLLERENSNFEKGSMSREKLEKNKMLVGSYLKPELQAGIVGSLEESEIYPAYGYFVTRGLSDAVLRFCRDSKLGAKIYADKMPFEGNSFSLGKEMNIDPVSAAMNGGDDYRLMYVVPIAEFERFRTDFQVFDIIGHVAREDVGAVLVTPDGLEHPISAQGW